MRKKRAWLLSVKEFERERKKAMSRRSDRFRDSATDSNKTNARASRARAAATRATQPSLTVPAYVSQQGHVVHSVVRHEHSTVTYNADNHQHTVSTGYEYLRGHQDAKRQRVDTDEEEESEGDKANDEEDDEAEELRGDQVLLSY